MQIRSIIAFSTLAGIAAVYGCSSNKPASGINGLSGDDAGDSSTGSSSGFMVTNGDGGNPQPTPCSNCTVMSCTGTPTTITGQVFDPAGKNPVYDVQVYIPNEPLPAFTKGVSCSSCSVLYPSGVFSSTQTDTSGKFTLNKQVPNGADIPLVIQIGKWRRQFKLSNVAPCAANDAQQLAGTVLSLPSSSAQGDLPDIAISTGEADSLECLPLRMGVSPNEYVPGASTAGHIHIFTGGASGGATQGAVTSVPSPQSSMALWDGEHDLNVNDVVLFSCEGAPTAYLDQSDGPSTLMAYLNNGGRVFASHYHFSFFTDTNVSPANPFVALTPPLATWTNLTNDAVLDDSKSFPADIVTTLPGGGAFPEGTALKTWLGVTGALDANGHLPVYYARDNATVTATNTISQSWAALDPSVSQAPNATQYFSFDTPIGTSAVEQCGRAVYSDLHVSGGAGVQAQAGITPDYQAGGGINIVPDGCANRALTAQEKALEFMIFDLTSCLVPIGMPPGGFSQPQ